MIMSMLPDYFRVWHLPIVFLAGLIGESYGVVVGSGSVVIQLVLTSLGMPLRNVVAVDITGAIGTELGIGMAARHKILPNWRMILRLALPMLAGGAVGIIFLLNADPHALRYIVAAALVAILGYTVVTARRPLQPLGTMTVSRSQHAALVPVMFVLGAYTTTISVGEGSFGRISLIAILGLAFADSMIVRGIAVLPTRIVAGVVCAASGLIALPYLLALSCGSFLAGHVVTTHIERVPERTLRGVLIVATVIYAAVLVI